MTKKNRYLNRGPNHHFTVTKEVVDTTRKLSGEGLTQEQIHFYFGIGKDRWYDTLKIHPELKMAVREGRSRTISLVAGKLMEKIKQGNLSAIIFYLKTQARWSDQGPPEEGSDDRAFSSYVNTVTDPVEASRIYQKIMGGD